MAKNQEHDAAVAQAQQRVTGLEKTLADYEREAALAAGELERCVDEGKAQRLLVTQTVARNRAALARLELAQARAALAGAQAARDTAQRSAAEAAEAAALAELAQALAAAWAAFERWQPTYAALNLSPLAPRQGPVARLESGLARAAEAAGVVKVLRTTAGTQYELVGGYGGNMSRDLRT